MAIHIILSLLSFLLVNVQIEAVVVSSNMNPDANHTFGFDIGTYAVCDKDETFNSFMIFTGAAQNIDGNKFSVAKIRRFLFSEKEKIEEFNQRIRKENEQNRQSIAEAPETNSAKKERPFDFILPLTDYKAKEGFQKDIVNPLLGSKISLMSLIGEFPVVVKNADKNIYFIYSNGAQGVVGTFYKTPNLNDSNGKLTGQIIKLSTVDKGNVEDSYIFAAVKGNQSENFGQNGSGIALVYLRNKNEKITKENSQTKKEEQTVKVLDLITLDADPSRETKYNTEKVDAPKVEKTDAEAKNEDDTKKKENKKIDKKIPKPGNIAAKFDGTINAIKINNDASVTSDIIDMHWDKHLARLYVACSVKANENSSSGARAVVVGKVENYKLHFMPITSDESIFGNKQIIGTKDSGKNVSIYKIKTMETSTLLNYLIVAGGNGELNEVGNKIYALPLVNSYRQKNSRTANKASHGSLAKYNQEPTMNYNEGFLYSKGRSLTQAANSQKDLLTNEDLAAIVGAGDLPLSPEQKIADMLVFNDAVYVSIDAKENNINKPGVYHSQAILDSKGRICAWSKWTKVITNQPTIATFLDPVTCNAWYIPKLKDGKTNSIVCSKWHVDQNSVLNNGLKDYFNKQNHSLEGLFDFPAEHNAFKNDFSMMILTGFNKIMFMPSSMLEKKLENYSDLSPIPGIGKMQYRGQVTYYQDNNLGPISCAEIVSPINVNHSWLFIAGTEGLYAMLNEQGYSFEGRLDSINATDLPNNEFKKIGNFDLVVKIQHQGDWLYVLTKTGFYRIDLSAQNFKTKNYKIETLADVDKFNAKYLGFNDFVIEGPLALVATSNGLFRNNQDINYVNGKQISWNKVQIPDSLENVKQLFTVSSVKNLNNISTKSQVYVLTASKNINCSRINRLFIDLDNAVGNYTVMPVEDRFVEAKLSHFIEYNSYKDNFWTDGGFCIASSNGDLETKAEFKTISPRVQTGTRSHMVSQADLEFDLQAQTVDNKKIKNEIYQLGKIVRNSRTGNLMTYGKFGLGIHK